MFPCGERTVEGGPVAKTKSRPGTEVPAVSVNPPKVGDTNTKGGQSRVSGEQILGTQYLIIEKAVKTCDTGFRRYSRMINFRDGWRGYLGQGRYSFFVMEGNHLLATARYIELNPVRAKGRSSR